MCIRDRCNTVDMAVFAYNESEKKVTKVLLIQRGNHPSIGWWALPGGFVEYRENLETAAARELQEETGIEHLSFEQLKTYGAYDRDPVSYTHLDVYKRQAAQHPAAVQKISRAVTFLPQVTSRFILMKTPRR